MIGITHHVIIAPPVKAISVKFIASSIETIEIKLIPNAVFNAFEKDICLINITVSRIIEVIRPLTMARNIILAVVQV